MKHTPEDPAVSVRDAKLPTPGPEALTVVAANAAAIARELISIRGLAETDGLALEAMRDAARAEWGALYRPGETGYRRVSAVRAGEIDLPKKLDPAVVESLLAAEHAVGCCDQAGLEHRVPFASGYARLQREFDHQPILLLLGPPSGDGASADLDLVALSGVAEVCAIALRNAELVERLQSEVFVDFVTHCYNRRAFEEHLKVELVRARRYERPLCLLLLDLDDFKKINDELGHQIGDHALARVGETLRATFRTTDRVCRYGGDEFAVIFPETPKEDVLRLAERLRRQVAKIFPDSMVPLSITSSIGVAGYPHDGARAEELVKAADRAMYRAKDGGRNQVVPA